MQNQKKMWKLTFKSEDEEIHESDERLYESKEMCDVRCEYIISWYLTQLNMSDAIEKHPVIKKYFNERNPRNHDFQYEIKKNLPKKALCMIYNKIFEGEYFSFSIEEV